MTGEIEIKMEICKDVFYDTFTNKYSTRGIYFLSGVRNIFISEETVKQMSEQLSKNVRTT